MDANGSRFHLLLGRADFGRCLDADGHALAERWDAGAGAAAALAWDDARAELSLRARLFQFPAGLRDVAPTRDDRRGAARDRYGNFYWIDETRRGLKVRSSGSRTSSDFWPIAPPPFEPAREGAFGPIQPTVPPVAATLGGLAVTAHHYLVAGTVEPAGLLVFDLYAGGPPQRFAWPRGVAFAPFDLAAEPGGGVLILDRLHRHLWRLDAHLRVARVDQEALLAPEQVDDFQPMDHSATRKRPAVTFPEGLALDASSPLAARDPVSVEVLADGRVLVLDAGRAENRLLVYRNGLPEGAPVPLSVSALVEQAPQNPDFTLVAHDMALVPEPDSLGRLYVASKEGNQAFAFRLQQSGGQLIATPLTDYLPMRLFGGKALIASTEQAFYDFGDGFIPLVAQRKPRYAPEATLRTPVLDGREPDCVWHRLFLDAALPPGASVAVRSRAANAPADLEKEPFRAEPGLHLRPDGPELPWTRTASGDHRGTFELLFQSAKGRYAQLELTLSGGGATTPRLHALRAYYPRFSYSERYLPGVYRQEPTSASFLERFLANFEGTFTTIEDRIAVAQALLDARSAPPEALDWLASWFGVALDPAWDEPRRRLFLRHALDFFQYRGTARGLRMALRLALDACPDDSLFAEDEDPTRSTVRIVEKFRSARPPSLAAPPAAAPDGIRVVALTPRWEPSQGRAQLLARYAQALSAAGLSGAPSAFPTRAPADAATTAVWRDFCRSALGFVPAATDADAQAWQEFLARRYPRLDALNELPTELPADGPAQKDWYDFESVVLPVRAAAHAFSVVLPVPTGGSAADQLARVAQAMRVVELEKPAHTVFDVKFYWAMFRLGDARLGVDTQIDLGGRSPQLMAPMVLGSGHLAESYLAPSPPQDATDRRILGRDPLGSRALHGSNIQ